MMRSWNGGNSLIARFREGSATARAFARRTRWLRTKPWPGFGEAFNGQTLREETIGRLCSRFGPDICIESGTFMGFTTRALAALGRPVVSIEVDPGYFHLSRFMLRDLPMVEVLHGDSARVLSELSGRPIERPLLYLDAHWGEELPLAAELAIAFASWPQALIVIDDFRVPGDPGYGYDTYGGIPLSQEEFEFPADATLAYPAPPAVEETGSRRGTLYVGTGEAGTAAVGAEIAAGALARA